MEPKDDGTAFNADDFDIFLCLCFVAIYFSLCFVAIIADMHRRVKFVVKVMGNFSRLVTSHVGVKQGYTLSTKLFSLFVNDLDRFMKNNGAPYVSLDWFRLSCMFFADDIALLADSRDNL
jgi:hypothetical protein